MIIRREHTANYAVIPNSTADDDNLKADALGVLVYLLAKPNDWQVNIANLRKRFGLGRNRVYAILGELTAAGYVKRSQGRNMESRFGDVEYVVFDSPEAQMAASEEGENGAETPLPRIREAAHPTSQKPNKTPASPKTVMRKSGNILNTNTTNPPSEGLAPPEGVLREKASEQDNQPTPSQPPTLNAQIWTEAKAILQPREHGCVSGWLQRVKDKPKGLETLLGIIETARRQGTPQAVPYITAALNKVFPPPPDPKTITRERWELLVQAAMNLKNWDGSLGPRPGEKGCHVPQDLITPDLVRAVSVRRVA